MSSGLKTINAAALPDRIREADIIAELNRTAEIPVVSAGLQMLKSLPSFLAFHSPEHTWSVLEVVITLSLLAETQPYERELFATAAAFHDLGFLVTLGKAR